MDYQWPHGKRFAFSICDDTDNGTLQNLVPVYQALSNSGIKTTKTVWSQPCAPGDRFTGQSLADAEYRAWIVELASKGFEIGWHGNRSGGSTRSEIIEGLNTFREALGAWPRVYANHANNIENLYWGRQRFDSKLIGTAFVAAQKQPRFEGSLEHSAHYWADICKERIAYVRDFTFSGIITTESDPWMPYFDSQRPKVSAWFSSSDAADVTRFGQLMTSENVGKLEASGGACILYVHFASGFVENGDVHPHLLRALADLRQRQGWYVPVSQMLDYISARRGVETLSAADRFSLEKRWALEHLGIGFQAIRHRLGFAA